MCIWLAAGWYWLMYVRFWLYISLQFVERIARNLRAWIVLSYAIRLSFRFVFSDSLSFVFVFFSFKLNYWNYSRLSDLIYLQNIKRNALKDWKKRPCRKSQFMENVFKIGKLPFIESDKLNRQYNFNWNCQSSANVIFSVWIEWWNHQDIEHRLRVSISQIVMVVIAVIWFRLTVYRNQMPSFQTKHRLELPYYKTMSFHTLLL